MARLKLSLWAAVISDCQLALNLAPSSMKAHYYLSQAQLAMGDYDGALTSALAAHAICAETNDRSLPAVTGMVLKAKKERWEEIERRRLREDKVLEEEVVDGLRRELYRELEGVEGEVARQEVGEEWEGKMRRVREVFERARSQGEKRREVPDWAIDDISFGIMVDPVVVSLLVTFASHVAQEVTRTDNEYNRPRPANHTNELPSWSISEGTQRILMTP
jgi:STIP1 family protein 1